VTSSSTPGLGRAERVPIADLMLDPENPRLPAAMQGASQEDLAVDLDLGFEALAVAESIASHGFFNSEPLIVIPAASTDVGKWIVVEGNRRLTALIGLARQDVRDQFPDPAAWQDLADRAGITPQTPVPVVVADSRASVVPIIGFRHISGILAWTPFAQARYVAKLVDEDQMSFSDVAKMIGIERGRAGNLYREQAIARQAATLGIETGPLESAFSLLTVAMSNTKLRDHVSAPLGSRLTPGQAPIPAECEDELRELLGWVFGSDVAEPAIKDSRDISKLGGVVGSPVGLAALRKGESLQQAIQRIEEAGLDTKDRLMKRLRAGRNALQAAESDIAEHAEDAEVRDLLDEVRDAIDALLSAGEDPETVDELQQ
jgi:hypothetical protein